jgi:hypothetical protein
VGPTLGSNHDSSAGEGGVENMPCDESKHVEGVKRMPYGCDVADAEAGGLFVRLCV